MNVMKIPECWDGVEVSRTLLWDAQKTSGVGCENENMQDFDFMMWGWLRVPVTIAAGIVTRSTPVCGCYQLSPSEGIRTGGSQRQN